MTRDQIILFCLLGTVLTLLVWGRIRYDIVAFGALVIALITGVVPASEAFSGFGHPATAIVALVLVVGAGLLRSGAIDIIARRLTASGRGPEAHISLMAGVGAALSSVMNNVAALALLMPIDVQAAAKAKRSPALTLMPLSFATILGGMVTLIGTPTNVVIATFREQVLGTPYQMFDFAPVGLVVAIVGVAFVALVGWRFLPAALVKRDSPKELTDLSGYVAEAIVPEGAKVIGSALRDLEPLADESDVVAVGLIRGSQRLGGVVRHQVIKQDDHIVLEGNAEAIERFIGSAGLRYADTEHRTGFLGETMTMHEAVVSEGSVLQGRSATQARLASRYGVTLLGVSRQGHRFLQRVRRLPIEAGDILLLLGPEDQVDEVATELGCLPLAGRDRQTTQREKAWPAIGIFAVAIVLASLGLVYLPTALAAVVVLYAVLRIVPLSQIYDSVEWPVIVLLGSLIPIGAAIESSGGAALLAQGLLHSTDGLPPAVVLTLLMVITMLLSGVLNNVATALIAAPVGFEIATKLGVHPDPFLMAVAVASSCAFLTPIGHKNSTIIMGPGGYRFGDYWRMGLPLEIVIVVVSVPMILLVWPL